MLVLDDGFSTAASQQQQKEEKERVLSLQKRRGGSYFRVRVKASTPWDLVPTLPLLLPIDLVRDILFFSPFFRTPGLGYENIRKRVCHGSFPAKTIIGRI